MMRTKITCSVLGFCVTLSLSLKSPAFASDCANFTGDWKTGVCKNDAAGTANMNRRLYQRGCESLGTFIAGLPVDVTVIGGIKTTHQTYPNGGETTQIEDSKWNSDRTVLTVKKDFSVIYPDPSQEPNLQMSNTITYRLEGDKLLISMTETDMPYEITCVFEK